MNINLIDCLENKKDKYSLFIDSIKNLTQNEDGKYSVVETFMEKIKSKTTKEYLDQLKSIGVNYTLQILNNQVVIKDKNKIVISKFQLPVYVSYKKLIQCINTKIEQEEEKTRKLRDKLLHQDIESEAKKLEESKTNLMALYSKKEIVTQFYNNYNSILEDKNELKRLNILLKNESNKSKQLFNEIKEALDNEDNYEAEKKAKEYLNHRKFGKEKIKQKELTEKKYEDLLMIEPPQTLQIVVKEKIKKKTKKAKKPKETETKSEKESKKEKPKETETKSEKESKKEKPKETETKSEKESKKEKPKSKKDGGSFIKKEDKDAQLQMIEKALSNLDEKMNDITTQKIQGGSREAQPKPPQEALAPSQNAGGSDIKIITISPGSFPSDDETHKSPLNTKTENNVQIGTGLGAPIEPQQGSGNQPSIDSENLDFTIDGLEEVDIGPLQGGSQELDFSKTYDDTSNTQNGGMNEPMFENVDPYGIGIGGGVETPQVNVIKRD